MHSIQHYWNNCVQRNPLAKLLEHWNKMSLEFYNEINCVVRYSVKRIVFQYRNDLIMCLQKAGMLDNNKEQSTTDDDTMTLLRRDGSDLDVLSMEENDEITMSWITCLYRSMEWHSMLQLAK